MWRTPATESRYSFYQMYWVNPKSERTTEIKFPPCVGFEPTTSWSIVQLPLLFGGKRYIEALSPVNGFEILISFLIVEMTYNQKWCSKNVSLLKPYENSAYSECNTFYHFKVVIKAWHTEALDERKTIFGQSKTSLKDISLSLKTAIHSTKCQWLGRVSLFKLY